MNAELNECAKSVDEYDRVLQANASKCIHKENVHLPRPTAFDKL